MKKEIKTEKKMFAKKAFELLCITLLTFLTFSVSILLSSTFVSAQTEEKVGVCLQMDGACDINVTQSRCEDSPNYGLLALKANGLPASITEIPGCQPGCCVFSKSNTFVKAEWTYYKRRCDYLADVYNLNIEKTDDNYAVCLDKNPKAVQGYCRRLESCAPSTQENCADGDFSLTSCPNCKPNTKTKCYLGDVYNYDSCDIPSTRADECNMNVEHCETVDDNNAECVPSSCNISLNFTTLHYNTASLKSGEIKAYTEQFKDGQSFNTSDPNADKVLTLQEAQSACVQYQGPGERHYTYTCMNGKLTKEALNSDRKEICYWNTTNGMAQKRENNYKNCGQCGTGSEKWYLSGDLIKTWNLIAKNTGMDVLNTEWLDYNLLPPAGLCDADICKNIGDDCVYIQYDPDVSSGFQKETNDCVPKYAPADSELCTECMNTKASSPWNKCTPLACTSRGYCESGDIAFDLGAAITICTMETFAMQYLSDVVDLAWSGKDEKGGIKKLLDIKTGILGGIFNMFSALLPQKFIDRITGIKGKVEVAQEKVDQVVKENTGATIAAPSGETAAASVAQQDTQKQITEANSKIEAYKAQLETVKNDPIKTADINNKIAAEEKTINSLKTPQAAVPAAQPGTGKTTETQKVKLSDMKSTLQSKTGVEMVEVKLTDTKTQGKYVNPGTAIKTAGGVESFDQDKTYIYIKEESGQVKTYSEWEKYYADSGKTVESKGKQVKDNLGFHINRKTTIFYSPKASTGKPTTQAISGMAEATNLGTAPTWKPAPKTELKDYNDYVQKYAGESYVKLIEETENTKVDYTTIMNDYFRTQSENSFFLTERLKTIIIGKLSIWLVADIFKLKFYDDLSPTGLLKRYFKKWVCKALYSIEKDELRCMNNKFTFPILFCTVQSAIESGETGVMKRNGCTGVYAWEMPGPASFGEFNMCHICNEDSAKICDETACSALSPRGSAGCKFNQDTGKCLPNPDAYCNVGEGKGKIKITSVDDFTSTSTDNWEKTNVDFIARDINVTVKTNKFAECRYFSAKDADWDSEIGIMTAEDIENKIHYDIFDISDYEKKNFTFYVRCKDYCGNVSFTNMTKVAIRKADKPDDMGPIITKQYPTPKMLLEGFKTGEKNEISIEIKTDEKSQCKYKQYPLAGSANEIIGYYEQVTNTVTQGIEQGKTENDVVASIPPVFANWTDPNMTMMNASDSVGQAPATYSFNHKILVAGLANNKTYGYTVLCMDQTSHASDRAAFINFRISELFNVTIISPKDAIIEKEPLIKVTTDRDALCRYVIDKTNASYATMSEFETTGQQDHRVKISPALSPSMTNYKLTVRCMDQINENIAKETSLFKLNPDTLSPKIIRVYKRTGDIQDTLYIATDEPTSCQYERKLFTYGKGIDMTNNEPASFEHEAAWGTETYYIICKDRESPANVGNTLVVNPYEIEIM